MTPVRQPRSIEAATALCERFTELDGQIATIEAERRDGIAAINARADQAANDLIAQRDLIAAKIEPWWNGAEAQLTKGKRKSIELGGCMLGTREGRSVLQVAGAEDDVVAALKGLRWAKPFVRVKTTLDRMAVLKGIDGKHSAALAKLGVTRKAGEAVFFIQRTEQQGTRGGQS